MVVGWWWAIVLAALAALWRPDLRWLPLAVVATPPLLMILKKRSVAMGLYSILSWTVDTAGLIRGLLSSVKAPPEGVIASKVVHDGNRSFS